MYVISLKGKAETQKRKERGIGTHRAPNSPAMPPKKVTLRMQGPKWRSPIYNNTTKGNETEKKESLNKYLTLLKSGGNDFPMEQLKKAGVDLTKSEGDYSALLDEIERVIKSL